MALNDLLVGPARRADDQLSPPRGDNYGGACVSDLLPKFAEQTLRGNMYCFSTALAGVALVAPTTTNAPAIWNPPNSGRLLIPVKVVASRTAKGTPLEGSIVYATLANAISGPGTGAPIVSLTAVAAVNCLLGAGDNSGMRFAPATISTTGNCTLIGASGLAQTADNGATTVSGPRGEMLIDYINGGIIVPPGNTFQLAAAVSISTTYTISIYALSIPIALAAS